MNIRMWNVIIIMKKQTKWTSNKPINYIYTPTLDAHTNFSFQSLSLVCLLCGSFDGVWWNALLSTMWNLNSTSWLTEEKNIKYFVEFFWHLIIHHTYIYMYRYNKVLYTCSYTISYVQCKVHSAQHHTLHRHQCMECARIIVPHKHSSFFTIFFR